MPVLLAGALLIAVIASLVAWNFTRPEPPAPPSPKRFVINLPETDRIDADGIALSPDGKTLVYIGIRDGVQQLYRRSMDQLEAVPIPATDGAEYPFFSPDGQWVGFFTMDKLMKVALAGGPAATLSDVEFRYGASWSRDDTILFSFRGFGSAASPGGRGLSPACDHGRQTQESWTIAGQTSCRMARRCSSPSGLPVFRMRALRSTIWIPASNGYSWKEPSRFISTGHIVFARPNSLWAVPFDPERLELTGSPAPILEDIRVNPGGLANYAIADDGSLVYLPGSLASEGRLVWVDREGAVEPLGAPARGYDEPRLSPDGRRLAVSINEENTDIWVFELERQTLTPVDI